MCCAANSQTALSPDDENQTDLEQTVKKAFDLRIKTGDPTLVYRLPKTVEIIKYIEPYLSSKDENIRLFVINLLVDIKASETVPLLVRGVEDTEKNNAEKASDIIFVNFDRRTLENRIELKDALIKSIEKGYASEAAYLLLGYFPSAANRAILERKCSEFQNGKKRNDISERAKFTLVCVLKSTVGTENGAKLIEQSRSAEYKDYTYLLEKLSLIEEAETLRILFQIFVYDTRLYVTHIDPSPPEMLAGEPRVLDLAINKFAERLKLNVGFKLEDDKRYTQRQVNLARRIILTKLNEFN